MGPVDVAAAADVVVGEALTAAPAVFAEAGAEAAAAGADAGSLTGPSGPPWPIGFMVTALARIRLG